MNAILKILFTTILFIYSILVIGQVVVFQNAAGQVVTTYRTDYMGKYISTHIRQYKGSPYLGVTPWHRGALIYSTGSSQPVIISLDIFTNTLRCLLNDSTEISTERVEQFYFEDKKLIKRLKNNYLEYYQLLCDGNVQLLKKYELLLKKTETIQMPMVSKSAFDFDGEFLYLEKYYALFGDGRLKRVMLNRKSVLSLLPEIDDYIKTQINKNGLVEANLISVFGHYNESVSNKKVESETQK